MCFLDFIWFWHLTKWFGKFFFYILKTVWCCYYDSIRIHQQSRLDLVFCRGLGLALYFILCKRGFISFFSPSVSFGRVCLNSWLIYRNVTCFHTQKCYSIPSGHSVTHCLISIYFLMVCCFPYWFLAFLSFVFWEDIWHDFNHFKHAEA